jgi:hypothetical protein
LLANKAKQQAIGPKLAKKITKTVKNTKYNKGYPDWSKPLDVIVPHDENLLVPTKPLNPLPPKT